MPGASRIARCLLLLGAFVAAEGLGAPAETEEASEEASVPDSPKGYGLEATLRLGYGVADFVYPAYEGGFAGGVYVQAELGYRVSPRWLMAAQISQLEIPVEETADLRFRALHLERPRGTGYVTVPGETLPGDGTLHSHSIRAALIGVRAEYSPSSLSGTYLALTVGLATLTLDDTFVRTGVGTSFGYRYAFAPSAALGIGIGLDASVGSQDVGVPAGSWVSFLATELRLF